IRFRPNRTGPRILPDRSGMPMDKRFSIFAGIVILALLLVAGLSWWRSTMDTFAAKPIPYSTFLDNLDQGQIRSVTINGTQIIGTLNDKTLFQTYTTNDPDLVKELRAKDVAIAVMAPSDPGPNWLSLMVTVLPLILITGLMLWFMARQPGGLGGGSRGNPM